MGQPKALYNGRRVLRSFHYGGGTFEIEDEDGYYAQVPITFELFLAPDADRCHLETVGKILSVWIASEYGKERGMN